MAAPRPPRRGNHSQHGPRSKSGGPPQRGGPASRRPGTSSAPPRRPFKPRPRPTQKQELPDGFERLQKLLAHAGVGSRRACEELILQGRVTVGGQVVRELGTKVDPRQTPVAVDGQKIQSERHVYYAVFKPKGYVSTNHDPSGRPRVVDILPEIPQRVYSVGRLDEMSVGLMLLTNDGELANKLSHPRFGVEKLYRVVVAGTPSREVLDQLTEGVWLAEGKVRAKKVRIVAKKGLSTVLEMVLAEGKNREVRRMLAKFGHKVMNLTRVAVGPVTLKGLTAGQFRPLTGREIDLLQRVARGEPVPMPWMGGDSRPRREDDRHHRPQGEARAPGDRRSGPPARTGNDRPPMRAGRPPQEGRGGSEGPRRFENQGRPGGRPPQGQSGGPRRFENQGRPGGRPAEGQYDGPPRQPRRFENQDRPGGRPPQGRHEGPPRPPYRAEQGGRPGGRPLQGQYGGPPRRFDEGRPGGPGQDRRPPRRFEEEGRPGGRPGQGHHGGPPRRFENQDRPGGRPPQGRNDGPPRPPYRPAAGGRGPVGPRPMQGRRPGPPPSGGPPQRRVIGMEGAAGPGREDRPQPRMKRPPGPRPMPRPGAVPRPMPRRRRPTDDASE